ncbi:acetylornithine aminotransferase [Limnobacter thiooxidans]|nr:aspartate aminotransferase family protein [Limnobacter sp.]MCZ8016853.1 aspartate aminotransferase family protein [Limnobacter sp.]RZS38267.1 acetylornithine aminotransferase [Limnobacter thiooxidans]
MKTYARQPIAFTHGDGVWMWSTDGKKYLDGLAGIAVNGLGHNHPKLVKAIAEQAGKLIHTSNLYGIVEQSQLADRLCEISGMDEAFFCNSGAEANEAAIKLAKHYGYKKGIENAKIIVMERAWHGRTLATLAATDSPKAKVGFGELPGGFVRVPYKNFPAIEQAAAENPDIQAVLLEVLQGEGGINVADTEYLQALRKLCTAKGWLLMIDEVQSGIGRTGKWFGYQHAGIEPDVITLAKGLGSGVPIGACLAAGPAAGVFTPGTHGTTFGGGPLVSVAALATIQIMEEEGLLAHAEQMGQLIRAVLSRELAGVAGIKDIRGRGLMVGVELWKPCAELVAIARDKGLIINVTRDNVVRLLPPLVIKKEEAETLAMELAPLIKAFLEQSA